MMGMGTWHREHPNEPRYAEWRTVLRLFAALVSRFSVNIIATAHAGCWVLLMRTGGTILRLRSGGDGAAEWNP